MEHPFFSPQHNKAIAPLFYRRLVRKLEELHEVLTSLPTRSWSHTLAGELQQKTAALFAQVKLLNESLVTTSCATLEQHIQQLTTDAHPLAPNTLQLCLQSIDTIEDRLRVFADHLALRAVPEHLILIATNNTVEANEWMDQCSYFGFDSIAIGALTELKSSISALQPSALIMDIHFEAVETLRAQNPPATLSAFLESQIPIIFTSEQNDFTTRLLAIRSGGSAFFYQPLEHNKIIEAIEQLLQPEDQSPFRILIVDDSKTQSSFLNATLHKAGILTRAINDPFLVTEALIEFEPDLILLDLYMPRCSGEELASVIRQQNTYLSIPIVFLSAESDLTKQRNALALGGDDFLTKPIDASQLISTVRTRMLRSRALRSQMVKDSLTGLLNHTQILERLESEISRAIRHQHPLCFVMLDIDHFKKINDTYGHPTGDRVIKHLSRILKQRFRKSDIIGRYGGEEFAIILPQTEIQFAVKILNEVRETFSAFVHHHEAQTFHVQFSAGISFLTPEKKSVDILCKLADDALYESKHTGRNKVLTQEDLAPKTT